MPESTPISARSTSAAGAEAALHLSEATRTAIVQTALDCIITIDHLGFVLDWNPAAERTFGYPAAEAVGREMAELIIPARLRGMHRHGLARAVASGRDVMAGKRVELSAQRRTGEEFPVELSITRIVAGPTPLFTGHIRDISARKQAERELRDSQQLLSSITDNISEAIFRRSVTEGLVFVNEAYVQMFGYASAAELRQVRGEDLYAQPARRAELVAALTNHGEIRNEEIEYRRKDGSAFWGLTSARGIRDEATGEVLYFDGAIHDITDRKLAEQRQAAQYAVVRALADSASVTEAAPKILQAVCLNLGWDLGTIWQVQDGPVRPRRRSAPPMLHCIDLWHRPGLKLAAFVKATRGQCFPPGIGLPGRIWETAQPTWVSDVFADSNFPRATIAGTCGLHGAFGFPVLLEGQVLGVVEFFSRNIRAPDDRLLEMFAAIGSQIGQFVERKRIEQEIRVLNKSLERRVAERTAELVATNDALRESESRYRTVAEHTPAAIVVMDTRAGRFIEVNDNAVRLFGMPRAALLKVGPADVSPEIQPDGRRSATVANIEVRKALEGATSVFEWVHSRADRTSFPCEVRVARMPAAGRELVIGAITDITARKRSEAELRAALEQEKELSRLKTNFVNVVSHEFRTPLGVILSAADILEHYFERLRPDQRNGHLQDIRYATRQMAGLMEEVLLLGRVEAGKMECKPEPLDLDSFCRRLIDEQLSATSTKCPIALEITGCSVPARTDQAVLRHIFTNLLSNAVKYSPAGRPVVFSVRREGNDALFEIRDEGIGIPLEDQKRLFEAFHRAGNVGEVPGTGLGLVIVKRCVDLHGGTIRVSSAPGSGTTALVRLAAFVDEPKPQSIASKQPKKIPTPRKRPRRSQP